MMSEAINNSSFDSNELTSRIFINTNNPKVQNQVQKKSIPYIKRPKFPPSIDPKDLLIIGKDNKPTRSPNAFIIYRKVFFKTVRDEGYILPMTVISSMASKSWEEEPEEIKNHYKGIAKEAYNYRIERFPKKARRRKRDQWNVISFKNNASIPTSSRPSTTNDNNSSNNNNVLENTNDMNLLNSTDLLVMNLMSNGSPLNIINNNNNDDDIHNNNAPTNNFEQFENADLNLQEPTYLSPLSSPDFNSFPTENSPDQFEQVNEFQPFDMQRQFSFPAADSDNSTELTFYFDDFNNDSIFTNNTYMNFAQFQGESGIFADAGFSNYYSM